MNLIEAIKSGKRFKRRGHTGWMSEYTYAFSKEDVLSQDYEIETEKKEITLYRYTVKNSEGRIDQLPWTSETLEERINNPMLKAIKTESKIVVIE